MTGLKLEKIKKTFSSGGKELCILDSLDLQIKAGEMVAIVGESGVGKTTLLHIIGAIEKPDSGSIYLDSVNVTRLGEREVNRFRNRQVGFLFQFFHLLPEFTALENAIMPLLIRGIAKDEAEVKGRELLLNVGLGDRLTHFPPQLSGGEQQRVAAVRAIVGSPRLLLADEPTGNLDPNTGAEMMKIIQELHKAEAKILILATHNSEIAALCDKIYVLDNGKLKKAS